MRLPWGVPAMIDADQEAQWRAEFEAAGEDEVRDAINFPQYHAAYQGLKLRCAVLWLREQARARRAQDEQDRLDMKRYNKWTFWAAVAAAIIGIVMGIGIAVTIYFTTQATGVVSHDHARMPIGLHLLRGADQPMGHPQRAT
jgi:hypothetical protein